MMDGALPCLLLKAVVRSSTLIANVAIGAIRKLPTIFSPSKRPPTSPSQSKKPYVYLSIVVKL